MPSYAVIGGTRYVGRRVVDRLLTDGADVTLITRGRASDPFGDRVTRRIADAEDVDQLSEALGDATYDALLHQVAYHPPHADALVAAAEGRVGRVVVTSTIEVYNPAGFASADQRHQQLIEGSDYAETDLDLTRQPIDREAPWHDMGFLEEHYGDGKRQAESIVLAHDFLVPATARLAHVLAPDDPTGRLRRLVDHVRAGAPIRVPPAPVGASSFVHADDAAAALVHLLRSETTGPVNVAAQPAIDVFQVVDAIARALGVERPTVIETTGNEAYAMPFVYPSRFVMSTKRLEETLPALPSPAQWLGPTITALSETEN